MELSRSIRKHYAKMGRLGAKARNSRLSAERRTEIARNAANERWARVAEERLEPEPQSTTQAEVTS